MVHVEYSSYFIRKYKKLNLAFKTEILERIEEFKNPSNHQKLKVHKLTGAMGGSYSFSVNHSDRIIFEWSKDKKIARLYNIGDHSIYE
jgi:mRNA-degrading endonuclease YafQ of YafQ-DinJ toxin-antitoxin module